MSGWFDEASLKWIGLVLVLVLIVVVLLSESTEKQYHDERNQNKMSCGERECGRVLHRMFPGYKFRKTRPLWLPNDFPGRKRKIAYLELDWYCSELKLAVEYNGRQHAHVIDHWHPKGIVSLEAQQERDAKKRSGCEARGVTLIVVWYTIRHSKIEPFLQNHPHIVRLRQSLEIRDD